MGYSVVAILVALVAVASADPYYFHGNPGYYPAVPYAYGYGGIPYSAPIHISLAKSAPVVSPYVAPVPVPVAPQPKKPVLKLVDVQEATQFHSQDGRGQFLFGYSIPNQARIESRTSDGTVRGSYSYLDPVGRAITVQYVADDSGYHAASNELPASVPGSVPQPSQPSSYQQRVAQQYAASYPALVPASIVGQLPKAVEDSPDVAAAREAHLRAHQAALEAHAAALAAAEAGEGAEGATPLKTPVSVTNDSPSDEEDVGEQEEVDEEDDKVMDEADEGVVVESDALSDNSAGGGATSYEDDHELTYEKDRYPKLQYNSQQETYDPARVHDEANQAVIVNNPEFAESPVSTRIGSEGQESQAQGGAGKGAFFYSFRHAVPVYVAVPQGVAGAPTLARQQPFPANRLYVTGGVLGAPGVLTAPGGPVPVGRSISERASLLGAVPLAAVHDAQVSPTQRGSIKDHQTLPLYISPVEVEEN